MAEEKFPEALAVYQKISDMMPDDSDVYLRIAQIYRELHQLDKAEENLVRAKQYAPGNLDVLYNEAMLYEAQGRYEDAIRVLSDAVAGIKSQPPGLASRRRSLSILYQQLGQLYRDAQNYQAAINTYEELGILVRNDIIDRNLFLDRYCGVIIGAWNRLEKYTALIRKMANDPAIWENFELITVLSQDWVERYPTSYPKGVRKLNPQCPWTIEPEHT
jgi:tetratricopeptide (TPR) repeat protein